MKFMSRARSMIHTITGITCLWMLLLFGGEALLQAQANKVLEENATFDQTSPGNVAQKAQLSYHEGVRDLKLARQLARKASEAEAGEKRDKLHQKSLEAFDRAAKKLAGALTQNNDLMEAYEPLGEAFRRQGEYQKALQIHAMALQKDADSLDNFRGWAESLMALNMLGNATQSYTNYVETKSPRAEILMDEMKKWLATKQTDPGDLDPAHVERMAAWIAEHTRGG